MDKKKFEIELSKLPLRAIAAFAARCARRVRPLFGSHLPGGEAIEQAIVIAEQMAAGMTVTVDDAKAAAKAAAWAANDAANAGAQAECPATANAAAEEAAYSAVQAAFARSPADAAGAAVSADAAVTMISFAAESAGFDPKSDLEKTMLEDLLRLAAMGLGEADTLGPEIDVTPTGPLGPLWPEGEPEWFRRARATAEAMLAADNQ
jgi:hypothetical protein